MRTTIGRCTLCGKDGKLTILDDEDQLCDECLDSEFTQCNHCKEYYPDHVEFFCLKDGQLICEYCREDFDDDAIDFSM